MSRLLVKITYVIIVSMNANTIINDSMTLEEKLKAIEEAMNDAVAENVKRVSAGLAPVDPQDLLQCEGCQ